MKIVALILTLFILKAGTALPISSLEWEYIQLSMEMDGMEDESKDCCDADQDKGCCGSGMCCCISVGGLTMNIQEINNLESTNTKIFHKRIFEFEFSYHLNFNHAVFQPPRLV